MSSVLNFAAIACYSRLVFSCVLHALRSLSHVLNRLVRVRRLRRVVVKSCGDDNERHVDGLHGRRREPLLGPRPQAGQAVSHSILKFGLAWLKRPELNENVLCG